MIIAAINVTAVAAAAVIVGFSERELMKPLTGLGVAVGVGVGVGEGVVFGEGVVVGDGVGVGEGVGVGDAVGVGVAVRTLTEK
jgi:UDP-3-O-[3-hydroxymyristoyl] glucosamine N-acyltransferase